MDLGCGTAGNEPISLQDGLQIQIKHNLLIRGLVFMKSIVCEERHEDRETEWPAIVNPKRREHKAT
jgi:hypothetical protein